MIFLWFLVVVFLFWKCVRFCFCFCCRLFLFLVCTCILCLLPCLTRCSFIIIRTGKAYLGYGWLYSSRTVARTTQRENHVGKRRVLQPLARNVSTTTTTTTTTILSRHTPKRSYARPSFLVKLLVVSCLDLYATPGTRDPALRRISTLRNF